MNFYRQIRLISAAFLFSFSCATILAQTAGFNNTFAILSINGGANAYYDLNAVTANTDFNGVNLGSFNPASNSLTLKGAEHNVWKCGGCDLTSSRLMYRIYPTSTPTGSFISMNVPYTSGAANGCGGQDQMWSVTGNSVNVLSGLAPGNYTLEVYSEASVTCSGGTVYASNLSANYKATFTIGGNYVTTNGGSGLAATYTTLASAITALNAATITAPVVITLYGSETAPTAGYSITKSGTAINTITIQGNGAANTTVTAFGGQASGVKTDAVFKIVGADYITLQNMRIQENAANTTTAAASNNMTEFGVGIFASTATDGAQNNSIQNCTISMGSTYQNSFGIYSSSAHSSTNGVLVATATTGTNSNNKIYGNTISNAAYGIYVLSPPNTATVIESGWDVGGSSLATANTITFGLATTADIATTSFSATLPAGITFRNASTGQNVRFNTITSNSLSYVQSGGLGGIVCTNGTNPTGITHTNTFSNNTITLTNTGTTAITGIDFGAGLSTGTIVSSTNNITINQTASAANSSSIIGIKANYSSATNTCSSNTIVFNQSNTTGALSSATTGITVAGVGTTLTASSNNVTFNQTGSGTATITGAIIGIDFSNTSTTINSLSNTVLLNQTTSVASGITNAFTGIKSTTAATTLNIGSTGNGNTITVKQNLTGSGTYGGGAISYVDLGSVGHGTVNVNANTFNTTSSTIRSTGVLNVISIGTTTIVTACNIKDNVVNIDRVATSGNVNFFNQSSTIPSTPLDVITGNSITFTNLAGSGAIVCIQELGGPSSPANNNKNFSSNTINVSGTNTGTFTGISFGYALGLIANSNSITVSCANSTVLGITTGTGVSGTNANSISSNTFSLASSSTSPTSIIAINGAVGGNFQITANVFSSVTFSGVFSVAPTVSAIAVATGSTNNIYSNTINNISVGAATSTGNPTVDGILISGGTSTNVYRNNIYGITSNCAGSTGVVNGVRISGGTTNTVYNNFIGNLTAPSSTNADGVRGISITSTTTSSTQNIYYNTIYLSGTSSGATFGGTGVFHTTSATATTSSLDLRNNNIVNVLTPKGTALAVAYRRSSAALTNYPVTANNNNFFGTSGLFTDGTNTYTTLATYKTAMSTRDQVSQSINPTFLSTSGSSSNFLHIDGTSNTTGIESSAQVIGSYTTDYDGDTRNVSTPDIGADEFISYPQCASYTSPTNVATNQLQTGVTLTWSAAPNASGYDVYFDQNASPTALVSSNQAGTTYATGALSASTTYYWKIVPRNSAGVASSCATWSFQTQAATPTLSTTPASPAAVAFGNQCQNVLSSAQTFTMTGLNLTGTYVTIAAPSDFTVSEDNITFSSSINVNHTSGSFSNKTIYVKFTPTALTSYASNITISGGGLASSVNVALTGTGVNSVASLSYSASSGIYCTGTAITALNATLGTTGGTVTYSVSPALPTGLSISSSTGQITGTPTAAAAATSYTITASNGCSSTTASVNITVYTALSALTYTSSSVSYCVNQAITANSVTAITGGGTITYSVSPALPTGLSLDASTGQITGTPTVTTASATYTVTATNGTCTTPRALTIAVANTASTATTGASSSITTTSATLAGTYAANCQTITSYGIEYSTTSGFANGAGTQVASTNQSAGSFTSSLTGLASGTTYYFKAYAVYSGTTVYGTQSSFTTTCSTASIPWTEGFEGLTSVSTTTFPNCWLEGTGTNWRSQDASTTTYNDPKSGTKYIGCVYSGTNDRIWTPGFQLTSGVSYDFSTFFVGDGYTSWVGDVVYNTIQSATGETVLGASFITAGTTSTSGTSYAQISRTFVAPSTAIYYFGIRISSTTTPWSSMSFDDFSLNLTPLCTSVPSAVSVSSITTSGASASWTAPGSAPANGYEYYVTTSSSTPSNSVTPTGSTGAGVTTATLSSLSSATSYYLWVRTNCNGTDKGTWTGGITFTTLCNALSVPWTEGFEGLATVGTTSFPVCWLEGTGTNWQSLNASTSTYNDARTGSNYIGCMYSGTNDRVWTPGFALTAGVTYNFSTYFVGDGYASWVGDVIYNTSQSAAGETVLGASFITSGTTSTSGTNYAQILRSFTAPTTGTYYFGIRISSTTTPWSVMGFDDFSLVGPCTAPSTQATSINFTGVTVGATTVNFSAASGSPTGYLVVRYPNGSTPTNPTNATTYVTGNTIGTGTVVGVGTGTTFTASSLSPSTIYDYYVYSYNNTNCVGPVYNTNSPLTGSQSTLGCPTYSSIIPVGPTGDYPSITNLVTFMNTCPISQPTVIELQSNYVSTVETFPLTLGLANGQSATNTITVRPAAGATNLSITSSNTTATLDLNGGDYWIFDGRPGGSGSLSASNLIISNTSVATGGTAVRFINDAAYNTIQYVNLSSSYAAITSGVVNFSTTTGTTGNDNNTLTYNNINGNGTAAIGVYSSGTTTTATHNNSSNTISNNNIYDNFSPTLNSQGVFVDAGSNSWIISGNSFYQTATRTVTAGGRYVGIDINSSGDNFSITGNFIGGSAASCSGTATYTGAANRFRGISLKVGTATPSSVQGNTIKGINITSTSGATTSPGVFSGIYLNVGSANIGTISGNTIGASTGTGSISVSSSTNGGISYGIVSDAAASAVIAISNNIIGSISTTGSSATISHSLHAIDVTGAAATITIASNQIGSTSTANSLFASNASTSATGQIVTGINSTSSATTSITGNTISNLGNAYVPSTSYTTASVLRGIVTTSGVNTISTNTIKDMTTAANATGTGLATGVIGISQSSTTAGQVISSNTISNLGTTSSSVSSVTGIIFSGPTTGTNEIKTNNVNSLTASTTASTLNGIQVADAGNALIYNNIIRLGINAAGTNITTDLIINGINQSNAASNHGIYFNSIYLGGAVASSANNTFAINSTATSGTRIIRNNIFNNVRTNGSGSGKHYSIKLLGLTGLTINNNDYWTGTSFLALNVAADVASFSSWQTATSQDANSVSSDPAFISPTGSSSSFDLHINNSSMSSLESAGFDISGISTDYDGNARPGPTGSTNGGAASSDIGADEFDGIPAYTCTTPTAGTTLSSSTGICTSGTTSLSLSGVSITGTGNSYQWYSSTDGTSYSPILGATSSSYTSGTLTQSVYYKCTITCAANASSSNSSAVNVVVNTPQVTSSTPATICGTGTAVLNAVGNVGSTLNWFSASSGGTSLFTGTAYTTPTISTSTNYFVEATLGTGLTSVSGGARTSPSSTTNTTASTYGLVFDVTTQFTLNSVDVYNAGSAGTMSLQLQNSSGTVLQSLTTPSIPAGTGSTATTISIGWTIPVGTGYRILAISSPSLVREASLGGFPYAIGSVGNVTNGYISGNSTTYYYFYNWNYTGIGSCKSSRTTVTASVTTPPSISASATPSILCAGESTSLSASSINTGYTYSWSNSLGSGASVSASPTSTTTYTVTGTDNSGGASNGCSNTATVAVTVNPLPSAITITPAAPTICNGDISNIVASGGTISSSYTNTQNFTSLGTPAGWSLTQPTGMTVSVNSSANAGGSANELVFDYTSTNASALALATMPVIDATNLSNLSISFKSFLDNYSATTYPYSIKLQTSTNNSTWSDAWTFTPSGSTTYTPTTVNTALSSLNGSPTAYIRFAFVGNTFGINLWYVDDISVTGTNSISTSLVWSPSTELYTNAGATTAYNGSATTSVYAKPSTTTTYTATSTSAAGCTSSNTVQVTVNARPTSVISGDQTICSGTSSNNMSIALTGAQPWSLTYTNGTTPVNVTGITTSPYTFTASPTTSQTYTVSGLSDAGCTSQSADRTGSAIITVNASPTIPSTTGLTGTATCGKLSIDVTSNGQEGQGVWSVPSNLAISSDLTSPLSSFSPASSNSFNVPITVRWTNDATSCFVETAIQFNQPNTSSLGTPALNDLLWGGLTNTSWTTSSNWYQYINNGSLNYWSQLTTGAPGSTDKVYTIVNTSGGICIGNNVADVAANSSVFNIQVSTGTTLNLSNGTINILGDLVNNGTITPGTGTVTFNGTGTQTISGTGAISNLNNMVVNKTSGSLTLAQPVRVAGTLTMTQGDIISDATNIIEIGSSASSVGSVSWTSGTVRGPMKRWFATSTNSTQASGVFPVGANIPGKGVINRYAQVNFTSAPGVGGYVIAEYKTGTPSTGYTGLPITYNTNLYIQNYEEEGYWDITPYNASGSAYAALNTAPYTLKLRMNNPSTLQPGFPPSGSNGNTIADISKLRIITSKGPSHNTWILAGTQGSGHAVLGTGDYLLEETGVTGFSFFNGGGNDNNPLPVELLNFSGTCNEGMVNLVWQTASEFNSSHFDVEKSTDGETWRVMTTIPSAGTSNELLTYQAMDNNGTSGSNYYRLRQVDNDGKEKLYDPINVSCVETTAGYFTSYPNPSGNEFQVVVNNKEILGACTLNIVDAQGKVIDQRSIEVKDGINMFVISEKLNPGIYFLNITNGMKTTQVIKHAVR